MHAEARRDCIWQGALHDGHCSWGPETMPETTLPYLDPGYRCQPVEEVVFRAMRRVGGLESVDLSDKELGVGPEGRVEPPQGDVGSAPLALPFRLPYPRRDGAFPRGLVGRHALGLRGSGG